MKKRCPHSVCVPLVLTVLIITAIPTAALANPVILDTFRPIRHAFLVFLFLFVNGLIGAIEGFIISTIFQTDFKSTVITMIVANCFSTLMGYVFTDFLEILPENPLSINAEQFKSTIAKIIAFIAYYIAAISLEYPFCFWIFRLYNQSCQKAIIASAAAQTTSYTIIIIASSIFLNQIDTKTIAT